MTLDSIVKAIKLLLMNIFTQVIKKSIVPIFILLLIVLQSCIHRFDRIIVSGNLQGNPESFIFISRFEGDSLALIDSLRTSSKGYFEFKVVSDCPLFVTIGRNNIESPILLLLQPGEDIHLESGYSNLSDYKVFGSHGSSLARDLTLKLKQTKQQIDSLKRVYSLNKGSLKIDSINQLLDSAYNILVLNHKEFACRLIKENTFSPVSILALSQSYDSIHPVFDYKEDRKWFRLVDSTLLSVYSSNRIVKTYHSKIQHLDSLNSLRLKRDLMFKPGDVLPNVGYPLITGENLFVSSIWFKFILVDFQSPGCLLCIKNNTYLKKIYSEYSPKGLVVIQVTLGVNLDSLRTTILRDSLLWYNAFVPDMYNSKLLDTLRITSLPSNYITDRWGVIKATNLNGEKLRLKLNELLPQ